MDRIEVIKKLLDEYADIKPVLTKVGYKFKAEVIAHKIDALYQPKDL